MTATVENRTGFIGSSDIAAIMGLSRWKSPLQLWAEKTGEVEPADLSDVEHVQLGTELEDFVAKKFERETGLKPRQAPHIYQHAEHGYMRAQVDRIITGTDELLECKTCSAWKAKEWEGEEIPGEYILQVMWQLGLSRRSVGHIACLIGGQSFKYKKISFDAGIYNDMIIAAKDFWQMVAQKTPPMAVGMDNNFMVELHPTHDDQIQQVQEMNDAIATIQQLKGSIKELGLQKDELEAKVKAVIGDNLGIRTGEYQATWKTQVSKRVDTQAIKDAGLFEKYSKETETRVLRIGKDKTDGNSTNS
jgi:putative phage-type endonuclease